MLGLKRGTVRLCRHDKEWDTEAFRTIRCLKYILGDVIKDIQHVGSTSVSTIKAKPIIDIAVAVDDFDKVLAHKNTLEQHGFYYRPNSAIGDQLLFASGSFYQGTGDLQTHFIHVVHTNSIDWINYINFRDYLNSHPADAKKYEALKLNLAKEAPIDCGREKYLKGKHDFITYILRKAYISSFLGKTVDIKIDRPMGSIHPDHPDITYPVNYGYVPNITGGDGEELDVYLLGVDRPVKEYTARIIGAIHRKNDIEDKLVAAPAGTDFIAYEIEKQVEFQEKFFETETESIFEKSCGTVLYTVLNNTIYYLLIRPCRGGQYGLPKGHMEKGETETETALRETFEETSINAEVVEGFRREIKYTMNNGITKAVVYFTAKYSGQTPKHNDGFEKNNYFLLPFEQAYDKLTYNNTKVILKEANAFLTAKEQNNMRY